MLDLNNFILNSSSSIDVSVSIQENSETEQVNDLENKDDLIDPCSFILLFAEILASSPVNEEAAVEPTDNQITKLDQPAISSGNLEVHTDNQTTGVENEIYTNSILIDNQLNTNSKSGLQSLNDLENNVAMAWINSESFQPPQSVGSEVELEDEFFPELESQLIEPMELVNKLKKETNIPNYKDLNPINDKSIINLKDDLLKNLNASTTTASFTTSETMKPGPDQKSKIDGLLLENTQNVIPPGTLTNNENKSAIVNTEVKPLEIPVDISNSQWADKFSEHIIWLGHQGIKSALIKIHPEDLGPLEISIKVVKDSASVNINSHSSHVREILDQALPRLREMMTEQGLNLTDVHIGSDANSRDSSQNGQSFEEGTFMSSEDDVQITPLIKRAHKGLIDYFA